MLIRSSGGFGLEIFGWEGGAWIIWYWIPLGRMSRVLESC